MSGDFSEVDKSIEEILIDLMTEKVMYLGVKVSLTRGVQASMLTAHGSGPSRATIEKRTKHLDDLVNVKLIPSILPYYIPPLASTVSYDSVSRDFDYTLITVYLLEGIRAVGL
jgi:hypothetical protein